MTAIEPGQTYLYRKLGGRTFHVNVIKIWWCFALVEYRVDNIDFDYSYYRTKWKPTWRMWTDET